MFLTEHPFFICYENVLQAFNNRLLLIFLCYICNIFQVIRFNEGICNI